MEKIKIGMDEEMVLSILGKPEEIEYRPVIKIYHGDPSQYGKEINNPNKSFYYHTGIDITALIIFDKNNKVTYVNVGGT